jgi:hypothetical protein
MDEDGQYHRGEEDGQYHRGEEDLKREAIRHFKGLFELGDPPSTADQAYTASLFPRFVNEEDNSLFDRPCTKSKIWEVLKHFSKDKSPCLDGWTIDFFTQFFKLLGDDLLELVENSRIRGKVQSSLNSTFLAPIPKENNPTTFGDYRPIALCNLFYKLIAKVMANKLNPILSRSLSSE